MSPALASLSAVIHSDYPGVLVLCWLSVRKKIILVSSNEITVFDGHVSELDTFFFFFLLDSCPSLPLLVDIRRLTGVRVGETLLHFLENSLVKFLPPEE